MSKEYPDNTRLYTRSLPRTMPMLPQDPRDTRVELLVTYRGQKQSRGLEIRIPPEEIQPLLERMEQFLIAEGRYLANKADIDRRSALI